MNKFHLATAEFMDSVRRFTGAGRFARDGWRPFSKLRTNECIPNDC
jgi:hypothetical protein